MVLAGDYCSGLGNCELVEQEEPGVDEGQRRVPSHHVYPPHSVHSLVQSIHCHHDQEMRGTVVGKGVGINHRVQRRRGRGLRIIGAVAIDREVSTGRTPRDAGSSCST